MSEAHPRPSEPSHSAGDVEVAVIGAGQAGLAIGHFLARQGKRFVILERGAARSASAWRERWESLTLFTPRRYSALPGLPFPGDPDGYPTRDEVIAYLERYAETFELPVELEQRRRRRLDRGDDGRFRRRLDGRTIAADQVVVATGRSRRRACRSSPSELAPDVFQTHSTRLPPARATCRPGPCSWSAAATPASSSPRSSRRRTRSCSRVGSRQKPLPQRLLGRDLFWWLTKARHPGQDGRVAPRPQAAAPRHADRLEPARARGATASS